MVVAEVLAVAGAFFMSWAIGATNAPSFGPVNAAHAAPVYRASLLVGVASLLGAVTQGGAVTRTVGSGLVEGATLGPVVAAAVLLVAAAFIIASTLASIPMPSAFLVIGSTIGAGYAVGGAPNMETAALIAGFWLAIPVVGMAIGYATARGLRRWVDDTRRNLRVIASAALVLGTYTAYTAGANQVGLPVGPLMHVVDVPLPWLFLFAGTGMLVGALTGSPRLIQAVSVEYSQLGPRRAAGALLAASSIAQVATLAGVPISFGQTVIFSVIGSGLVEEGAKVGRRKLAVTVGAWAAALCLSAAVMYAIAGIL